VAGKSQRPAPEPGRKHLPPKLYLGRKAGQLEAVIGSASLTGGLWTNVEALNCPLPTTSGQPHAAGCAPEEPRSGTTRDGAVQDPRPERALPPNSSVNPPSRFRGSSKWLRKLGDQPGLNR
jgi:hypothetical protein